MLASGQLLLQFLDAMKAMPTVLSRDDQQQFLDIWIRWLTVSEPLDLFTPKAHLMVHLILRAGFHGNPLSYQCFLDESLNSVLKKTARNCHQAKFESSLMLKLEVVLRRKEATEQQAKRRRQR